LNALLLKVNLKVNLKDCLQIIKELNKDENLRIKTQDGNRSLDNPVSDRSLDECIINLIKDDSKTVKKEKSSWKN